MCNEFVVSCFVTEEISRSQSAAVVASIEYIILIVHNKIGEIVAEEMVNKSNSAN